MKRILYVTDRLIAGGTEQQLVELIRALDRRRFQPYVLCLYGRKQGCSLHYLELLRKQGVQVLILDQSSKLRLVASIVSHVWRTRPDLIQMVNYHGSLLVRLARPLLPPRVKLVSCVYVEYTGRQMLYERLSAWMCDTLVCNSPHIERQLHSRLGKSRIRLICNGIDIGRFSGASDGGLRKKYAPDADCVFLVMGRIARQKAVHLAVDALGLLKQRGQLPGGTSLWIVGECVELRAQDELERSIRQWGLEAVVRQFPATEQSEIYYQAADAVVLASLWEGLPNVLLESFAAGRPVIVSEAANRAGLVRSGCNGWIVPTGDVEQLAAAFRLVLDMRGALDSMRLMCRQTALPFAVTTMAQLYSELYDELSAVS